MNQNSAPLVDQLKLDYQRALLKFTKPEDQAVIKNAYDSMMYNIVGPPPPTPEAQLPDAYGGSGHMGTR